MDNFGLVLRIAREHAGLTQTQLAEKAGLATVTIGQYERGGRRPKAPQLQRLADALGVPVQVFDPQFIEQPQIPAQSERYIPDPSERYIPGVDDPIDSEDYIGSECWGNEPEDEPPIIGFGPNLGENIQIARKAAGLTQTQLGELIGVSLGTIQQYESGRRRRPRVQHLQRLAEVFGVSVYDLAPKYDSAQIDDETPRLKTRLEVEVAYLEDHHRNQWLDLMTRDGAKRRYFHGELTDILYEMTPETIELVTAFAKFMKQQEAEYFIKNSSLDKKQ